MSKKRKNRRRRNEQWEDTRCGEETQRPSLQPLFSFFVLELVFSHSQLDGKNKFLETYCVVFGYFKLQRCNAPQERSFSLLALSLHCVSLVACPWDSAACHHEHDRFPMFDWCNGWIYAGFYYFIFFVSGRTSGEALSVI